MQITPYGHSFTGRAVPIDPEAVIPCHYGSFPIIEPNADKFVAGMKGHATKAVVPEKGKPIRI